MLIETIHLTQKAKDQLIKLKRTTGIQNWNILCRWGLCLSLADPTTPPKLNHSGESAIEMTWKTFGGLFNETYAALFTHYLKKNKTHPPQEEISNYFRDHLHRGIGILSHQTKSKNIDCIFEAFKNK